MDFKLDKGSNCMRAKGCSKIQNNKLNTYDWLCGVPDAENATDFVEVQFKNTRKGYYLNQAHIPLEKGDMVAVEATPGHDIGMVTLTGKLVLLQMRKNNVRTDQEPKKIYRKARPADLEKYEEAKSKEHATMIRSRQIAAKLGLDMKIGDVEYQGDGNKAIFYYIADERVDFRQLIKVLAEAFRVRIEMKQIGARQEAGRIGGIGPCGRELCCSSWMTNFVSVATGAARYQDISMNPQKLAGQCAKLKCCINYEVDAYVEAQKRLPSREIPLETKDNTYFHFKTDIFKREITYSTDKSIAANLVTIPAQRVFDIINMNKKGIKPETLEADTKQQSKRESQDILGQESVTRFDNVQKKKKKKRGNGGATNASEPVAEKAQPANNQPKQAAQPAKNAAPVNEKKTEKPQEGKKQNAPSNNNNNNANNGNAAPKPQKSNNNRPKQKPKAAAPEKQVNGESNPIQTNSNRRRNSQPTTNRQIVRNRPITTNPRMLKKIINSLLAIFICALSFSCDYQALYYQYQVIDHSAWGKDKVYYFTFMVTDNSIPYDITLDIRNSNKYPYQNLWLFCNEEPPVGEMQKDTIECMLADEFGKWYGSGISLYESSFPIRQNYRFANPGQYTFSFRQGMRDSLIIGIQEIGLRVVPANAPSGLHPDE